MMSHMLSREKQPLEISSSRFSTKSPVYLACINSTIILNAQRRLGLHLSSSKAVLVALAAHGVETRGAEVEDDVHNEDEVSEVRRAAVDRAAGVGPRHDHRPHDHRVEDHERQQQVPILPDALARVEDAEVAAANECNDGACAQGR